MIHSHPEAVNLLKVYYLHKVTKSDRQALHNLLVWNKNYLEAGIGAVVQAHMHVCHRLFVLGTFKTNLQNYRTVVVLEELSCCVNPLKFLINQEILVSTKL